MGGWIYDKDDLEYPNIRIEMAELNKSGNYNNCSAWVSRSVSTCTMG